MLIQCARAGKACMRKVEVKGLCEARWQKEVRELMQDWSVTAWQGDVYEQMQDWSVTACRCTQETVAAESSHF